MNDTDRHPPLVSIVIPCFNEQQILPSTAQNIRLEIEAMISNKQIHPGSYACFVDDGSTDQTWQIIQTLNSENRLFKGITLSKNFGHQKALLAGMMSVRNQCDCLISVDADLQQDLSKLSEFVEKYIAGAEIIFGVRTDRKTDSIMKKTTALFFYNLMKWLGVTIIKNHADYRLVGNKALHALKDYHEVNIFLRGLFTNIGFKTDTVYFDVKEREAGTSKYNTRKMLSFALEGITSFSIAPLRMFTAIGCLTFSISILMAIYVLYIKTFTADIAPGWASTVIPIYFLGGVQIIGIGLIGEYIGKIYQEVKGRPRYIIEHSLLDQ